jgi:hypothetical protein
LILARVVQQAVFIMSRTKSPTGGNQQQSVKVRGTLVRERARVGTASQHESWVIQTKSHGDLLLKDIDANPFELGPAPAKPGSQIEAEGYVLRNELRYLSVKTL